VLPGVLYNGHYYYLTTSLLTYANASAFCESGGGYLATISSAAMNTALVDMFGGSSTFWIGYTRASLPCGTSWVWQDGSSANYTNWYPGEPNCRANNEYSVEINYGSTGYWNDVSASQTHQGICSVQATGVIKQFLFN